MTYLYKPNEHEATMMVALRMIQNVPPGNYAVQQQEGDPFRFYRLTFPEKDVWDSGIRANKKVTGTKIQRRSSDDLKDVLLDLPTNEYLNWTQPGLDNDLLAICVDWKAAAKAFAKELQRCGRCGKSLTDIRSRWYLLGPECETYWEWWVPERDEEEGMDFEEARAQGLVEG